MTSLDLDRRAFLQAMMGTAGAVLLGSCGLGNGTRTGNPGSLPGPSVASSRPTLHLAGHDYGFPSPFSYFPPGFQFVSYVYDTLLWPDSTGMLQPWLASRFDRSPDGLTYTFQLRDNVLWHDGQPLTADDVVFSIEYFNAHKATLPPYVIFGPKNIATVRAEGAGAVRITLDKPVVTFARTAASSFPIVPRHIWSGISDPARVQDPRMLVGSGPYRLESYSGGEGSYLFTANPRFFLGTPYVKRLELRPESDELNALLTGDIDAGGSGISSATDQALTPFTGSPDFGVLRGPADFPAALTWNLAKGGALADVRFRRACALAIDRKEIVRRLFGHQAVPGNPGFLPDGHPYRVPVEQYPFDREAANRILDEAGYARGGDGTRRAPGGQALRFKLLAYPELASVVELVIQALRPIGVELEVDPVEFFEGFGALSSGRYDMAMTFYAGISDDPDYMRQVYSSRVDRSFLTVQGYRDAEFDDLAERQLLAFDEQERKHLVARMQQIVARDIPLLHIYYSTPAHIYRRSVFDQWSFNRGGGGPYNKQALVTGVKTGGLTIRPVSPG